jgi:hypothetical protein
VLLDETKSLYGHLINPSSLLAETFTATTTSSTTSLTTTVTVLVLCTDGIPSGVGVNATDCFELLLGHRWAA